MLGKIKYRVKKSFNMKNSYLAVIGIVSVFLLVGGFSYALFTSKAESKGTLNIITGNLYSYIESEELDSNYSITLNSNETKVITIYLKNTNVIDAKFNLWYEAVEGVSVSYDDSKDTPPTKEGYNLTVDTVKTYKIKITNNTDNTQVVTFGSEAGLSNKELSFPDDKKVIDTIVAKVKMDTAMIPVVYDGTKWVKAREDDWYDYDLGKWANAVTVSSASRSKYQSAEGGSEVLMTDIETMWVYIPRYSYTIGSEDGEHYYGKQGSYLSTTPTQSLPGEIDVKFIKKSEKDMGSAQYKVANGVSGWRTPDAFTFGDEELSGIWVGKFETSSSNPSASYGGGNVTTLDPMIKPNIASWRGIQVANIGEVGRKLSASGNQYGLSTSMDSHAMKNSEWGAVAYLSQSKYGKLGNRNYGGVNKEIYINKSDQYITGCSYGAPSSGTTDYGCQYTYDIDLLGTGASTTGTIYGIYDMSGGAVEYTMGNYFANGYGYTGYNDSSNSGYTGLIGNLTSYRLFHGKSWLADKYYDFYTSNDAMTACNGNPCYSHTLQETGGWYNDYIGLAYFSYPWLDHGGLVKNSEIAGIFFVSGDHGGTGSGASFRLVLVAS